MNGTVLVTGATGLIGSNLIKYLLENNYRVIGLVRNVEKANKKLPQSNLLSFVVGDITQSINISEAIDYIVHGASNTSSKAFIDEPVEIINTALKGTQNMLELARTKNVKSFVYLSSMEVYGSPSTDEKISEDHCTNLDTMSVRSSYPESKRMCEALCAAYYKEYGVPVKVARLTQTFGAGVEYNDKRVFAEFARCAIEGRDIVLHTKGETKRCYLSTDDAVSAIMCILLKGENGEAYNVANEETYCTIYEMAQMVAHEYGENKTKVRIEIEDETKYGYAPVLKMNLDTSKLKSLGWKAKQSLNVMYSVLLESMRLE